jgi:hypothetical protein
MAVGRESLALCIAAMGRMLLLSVYSKQDPKLDVLVVLGAGSYSYIAFRSGSWWS